MTLVCVWCQREGKGQPPMDAAAILGICADHANRFLSEVDAALESDGRRSGGALTPPTRARWRRSPSEDVVTRVADLLAHHTGDDLCDRCVAAALRCSPGDVESVTVALSASPDFLRDEWRCGRCGARTLVTRARAHHPDSDLGHPLLGLLPPVLFASAAQAESDSPTQTTLRILMSELGRKEPASRAVVERLIEVLFSVCAADVARRRR